MHPQHPTLTHDPDGTPVWSQSVNAPLFGLLDWSADPYDCDACGWTCEPVTRAVLGDRWGGLCAFHLGAELGAQDATEWTPEDYPGWFGWRRAARRVAAVALAASYGAYSPRQRRAARRAAGTVWGSR